MMYYGIDTTYLLLVLPALLLSIFAQLKVKSAYGKYSAISNSSGLTGAEAARRVLQQNAVTGVRIERVSGTLSDHFDPRAQVIRLSDGVYDSNSIAAIGIAAHEAGHAVQYAKNYLPVKLRTAIFPISRFGSTLAVPMFLFGLIFNFSFLINLGIIFFFAALIFQVATLPVELNASSRALDAIKKGCMLSGVEELKGAKKVLSAAAFTYIAAMLVSLGQFLRFLLIARRRSNR